MLFLENVETVGGYCTPFAVSDDLRPLQNPHLRRISALCAARSLAYLFDMSALAVLLRLELHPHLGILQRSQPAFYKYNVIQYHLRFSALRLIRQGRLKDFLSMNSILLAGLAQRLLLAAAALALLWGAYFWAVA